MRSPVDREDLRLFARLMIYAVLTLGIVMLAGVAVRLFLIASGL